MDIKEQVLKVMKEAGKPVSAGEVEKLSGLDRKDIDKAFQALKKEMCIRDRYHISHKAQCQHN